MNVATRQKTNKVGAAARKKIWGLAFWGSFPLILGLFYAFQAFIAGMDSHLKGPWIKLMNINPILIRDIKVYLIHSCQHLKKKSRNDLRGAWHAAHGQG